MCVCVRVLLVVLGVNMEEPCVKLVCLMIGETGFASHVCVCVFSCVCACGKPECLFPVFAKSKHIPM